MRRAAPIGAAALAGGLVFAVATPALAQVDLVSPGVFSGQIDVRLSASDGETSWTQGGFGKTRYGGSGAGETVRLQIASADLVWRPRLAWDLSGFVDAVAQPDQAHGVDLSEAYVLYKPLPRADGLRYSARAGLMYPPVSMENDGPAWTPSRTITPSAIDSWIGEEVKTWGGEATIARRWEDQEVSATAGVFAGDDTSGTLLTWRGWALHDVRSTAFGDFPIPQVPAAHKPFFATSQGPYSRSVDEIDGRPGVYARAEWRAPGAVTVNLFYYDNAGDRTSVVNGQWSWDTTFWNLGLRLKPDDKTEVLAQAMTGRTVTGFVTPVGWRVDAGFDAAYLLVSHDLGKDLVTGRIDGFQVRDHTFQTLDNNNERGWALTADYRHPVTEQLAALVEVLHVYSDRPSRAYVGQAPRQAQTTIQTALKLAF
ncbi:MAG: hypothetical protein JWO72_1880 [Caulobacteraceae bacterium]|jgi:hypothetical protein|nr:hypothetical protein [Caulobacteraceae bacterium]